MKASSRGVGNMAIGRTCARQSNASATSSANATRPSSRSRTTPPSATAGASRPLERRRAAACSLGLRLFVLIALLSILPVVLFVYVASSAPRTRENDGTVPVLRSHSRAVARGFIVDQVPAEATRTAGRSAQLAGFGAEASGARPTLAGSLLMSSVWESRELQLAAGAYLALLVLAIVVALDIVRSLRRFRDAASDLALGRVGDNALISRTGMRELSGVARLLDRLVFDLRYMSDQMRLTAAENAHSMRTPLATMQAAMGAIRRSLPAGEPRAQRALEIVDISLDRLRSVVNSVQRNDTIMADLVAQPRTLVDLSELARDVAGEIGERATPRNIRIRERLQDGIVVHAGAGALRAALIDVISSAVEASPRHGEVILRLESREAGARLVVEDAGGGAEAPELFFQHDFSPSSDADDDGPGRLGLWSVKRTVEAFGGEVSAERSQRGGAVVCMVLPAELNRRL